MPTIQIADKPTLDKVNSLSNNICYHNIVDIKRKVLNTTYKVDSSLPADCAATASVTSYNGKLYLLSSNTLYRFDGSTWTQLPSICPISLSEGYIVAYENCIHLIGGISIQESNKHYRYDLDTDTWTELANTPYKLYESLVCIYNDEIHLIGGSGSKAYLHYKYNTSSGWVLVSDSTPMRDPCRKYSAIIDGILYALVGFYIYKFDGTSWKLLSSKSVSDISDKHSVFISYNNEMHILGGSSDKYRHYKYNFSTSEWESVSTLPYEFYTGHAICIDNEIYILGGNSNERKYARYREGVWEVADTSKFSKTTLCTVGHMIVCMKDTKILCNPNDLDVVQNEGRISTLEDGYLVTENTEVFIVPKNFDRSKLIYTIL